VIWPSGSGKTLQTFIICKTHYVYYFDITTIHSIFPMSTQHFVTFIYINTQSHIILKWRIFEIDNSHLQLHFPQTTLPLFHCYTLSHSFAEYACYPKWEFVFVKGEDSNADWGISTSHCRLAVLSVTTNDSHVKNKDRRLLYIYGRWTFYCNLSWVLN
jgi:hypothetical protein